MGNNLKWYREHQNNSGGSFIGPAIDIYVEAPNPGVAWEQMLSVGCYEDEGQDCSCCGSRWSRPYDYPNMELQTLDDVNKAIDHGRTGWSAGVYRDWAARDCDGNLALIIRHDGTKTLVKTDGSRVPFKG